MASNLDTHHVPPRDLHVEHQDALIIYATDSPDDKIRACELRDTINGFCFDNFIMGKAVLYDETIQFGRSLITSLDDAIQFSTLLFALYSKDLEKDPISCHTTNASLWHTIENKEKSGTFIPVIWKDGVALPAYAREKRPLDMSKGNWRNLLKKLINNHLEKRLEREKEQECLRSRCAGMSNRATNSVPPNGIPSRHVLVPSQNQESLVNFNRQGSVENIDVHGGDLRTHDADANGHGASQSPWKFMRCLVSERGLHWFTILSFFIVSLTLVTVKARQPGT